MRNSFKIFDFNSSAAQKHYIVKFNPNGVNSSLKTNLGILGDFSKSKISNFNAILVPINNSKNLYTNFTYKYFLLKWSKFETKKNYYKNFKSPDKFPNFIKNFNFFANSSLKKRKLRRFKRKLRILVYFRNRPIKSSKLIYKSYRLSRTFFLKKKKKKINYRKFKKLLLRPLSKRKLLKFAFFSYWRRSKKFKKNRKIKKFIRRNRSPFKINFRSKVYFERRRLSFRIFKFFNYKKLTQKLIFARKYAYLNTLYTLFDNDFDPFEHKKIFGSSKIKFQNLRFFRRLSRKLIRGRRYREYRQQRLDFKVQVRIFEARNFKNFIFFKILKSYLNNSFEAQTYKSFSKFISKNTSKTAKFNFLFAKKNANFTYFRKFRILITVSKKFFKNKFLLNLKNYIVLNNYFSKIDRKFNFIPFNFIIRTFSKKQFYNKIKFSKYIQRRKFVRSFRFLTYFFILSKIFLFGSNKIKLQKLKKKFIRYLYSFFKSGQLFYILPIFLNKFFYFGLVSHFNHNIYSRDPYKFNNFNSYKNFKKKFVLTTAF